MSKGSLYQGLGKNEHGVLDPIRQGEVRDKQDKFKVSVLLCSAVLNFSKLKVIELCERPADLNKKDY